MKKTKAKVRVKAATGRRRKSAARKPRSPVMASIHEAARDLYDAGYLREETMREFDASCLTPIEQLSPRKIQQLRRAAAMSQPVFARYLNVGAKTISKWERGESKPDGPSLKLLNLVKQKGVAVLL